MSGREGGERRVRERGKGEKSGREGGEREGKGMWKRV